MGWVSIILGSIVFTSAALLLLKIFQFVKFHNKDTQQPDNAAEDFLNAKEIFVRDPLAFRDKDKDGIDDIVDKNV